MKAAIYSRFSTDRQSESSIVDQVRVCSEHAAAQGWYVAATFEDQGISGAAIGNRPGVRALIKGATAGEFGVVIVTDLSRLSRSTGDLNKLIDRFVARGLRVIGVQDGYDSTRRGHKLQAGLSGIIGEAFREMVKERTYTALETRARANRPTGGRAYGYGEGEAEVVREIFQRFADGESPRAIAGALNARGVPSPGSSWSRVVRRCSGWMESGVRALILNERYSGRVIWNRSVWTKDPDTGKRIRRERPASEWIVHQDDSQRLVPADLWERVQARQREAAARVGDRIRASLARGGAGTGRGTKPKYLLSGLLTCAECGAAFVMSDRKHYTCSTRVYGGLAACSNDARLARCEIQRELLAGIKRDLRSPYIVAEIQRLVRQRVREKAKGASSYAAKIGKLEREVANLTDAIASGALRASPALAARLTAAEGELNRLRSEHKASTPSNVERLLPRVADEFLRLLDRLDTALVGADVERGRAELRGLLGPLQVVATPNEIRIETQKGRVEAAFLRAVGLPANNLVAGAGFEPATFGL